MSGSVAVRAPSGPKKSIRMLCAIDDVLPITISVDHSPPVTTCAKMSDVLPPMKDALVEDVVTVTGVVVTVTGVENVAVVADVGGNPRPNPGVTDVLWEIVFMLWEIVF